MSSLQYLCNKLIHKKKKTLTFDWVYQIVCIFAPIINNRGRVPQNLITMSVKIRLQRHGKKGKPFYWIVATDSRAKRDGKYLEKLGTYNPLTNPATVELNVDHSVKWLQNGAQPTDTARDLLSSKGVLLKNHLLTGVRKGALSEEEAEKRFQAWVAEKEAKLADRKAAHEKSKADAKAKALEAEKEVSAKRAAAAQPVAEETAQEEGAEEAEAPVEESKTAIEKEAEAAKTEEKEAEK